MRPHYSGGTGTYTILSDTTVIHLVQRRTFPEYIGTNQRHTYQIRSGTLSTGAHSLPRRIPLRGQGAA